MRTPLTPIVFCYTIVAVLTCAVSREGLADDEGMAELADFRFESGATMRTVRLAYRTLGTLNKDKSNAVLLPSHYAAGNTGYDYLIGKGKAVDPARHFIVLIGMFGNGISTSPSNAPAEFRGPQFPTVSIHDNVRAQAQVLRDKYGITQLAAILGFSMGGQQAYQWAVTYPQATSRIVVICSNAKQYPFGVIRLQGSIAALKADQSFMNGLYQAPPLGGLRAFGMHYRGWGRHPQAWERSLFDDMTAAQVDEQLAEAAKQFDALDANNLLSQAETWKRHDVSRAPGSPVSDSVAFEKTLRGITARVLLLPTTTDQYFPQSDSEYEAALVPGAKLVPIATKLGHAGGGGADPSATEQIDKEIATFLKP